ncbi:MAG: hypothetical protein ACRC4T_06585, partial [Cetobacterium sp.]
MKEIIDWLKFILIYFGIICFSLIIMVGWQNILGTSTIASLISIIIFFGHAGFSIYQYSNDKPQIYY